jgi:hypothetical protein
MIFRLLADAVVVIHLAYVLFVVFALVAILLGAALGWQWIRNFWFRIVHLLMIGVVVVQSVLGATCPLTTLENSLRRGAGQADYAASFIGHWAHELLFIEATAWQFTVAYCTFGGLVLLALLLAPPRLPKRGNSKDSDTPADDEE